MTFLMKYAGRSGLHKIGSAQILNFSPNIIRDEVAFDAPLNQPIEFREAISALHDIVINDLRFQPKDRTAYEQFRQAETKREQVIRESARVAAVQEFESRQGSSPSTELKSNYKAAKQLYWTTRKKLNTHLQKQNRELWRKLMPYDPVITVEDDVVFFECFSADESSYGCLTCERDRCFGTSSEFKRGTTNVDYSWDLYHHFQSLRSYRDTRLNVVPAGLDLATTGVESYHEEKIDLPGGWLNGFMQLQAAMGLPARKVDLSVSCVYSLLAFLKRNKAKTSPRALRFELNDGEAPKIVLEPWEKTINSPETLYSGLSDEPIRVWGRRRLLSLARVLPLAKKVSVYLLGTGLPSFWVVDMGPMKLTLGLSGWTTNDWTAGSAVQYLLPQANISETALSNLEYQLKRKRTLDLTLLPVSQQREAAEGLNQLGSR